MAAGGEVKENPEKNMIILKMRTLGVAYALFGDLLYIFVNPDIRMLLIQTECLIKSRQNLRKLVSNSADDTPRNVARKVWCQRPLNVLKAQF